MLTKDQLAAFEAQHKRIAHLKGPDVGDPPGPAFEVVLRKPTRAEYKMFRAQCHNPAQVADAQEILVRKCLVWPPTDAIDALLDDWPGIPEAAGAAILKLTGAGSLEEGK